MLIRLSGIAFVAITLAGCGQPTTPPSTPPSADAGAPADQLQVMASMLFTPLQAPDPAASQDPAAAARITLGRMLYYDTRLSRDHAISCNSCHDLASYGVDGEPTSSGFKGQRGSRNSPTTYNASLHIAQFWDGRAADVEEQAKGPVLNPVEMAMPDGAAVVKVLKSIPGYLPAFQAAFPGEADPVTYDNAAAAIGAFERGLVTPSPFDAFLAGDAKALSAEQRQGLDTFMHTGCGTCHSGVGIGGGMYQKIGLVQPFDTSDPGRAAVTGSDADKFMFKVPSLRNITETGPYFHDGEVGTLDEAISLMATHQLGKTLTTAQVREIAAFLGSLKGPLPAGYIAKPELPASGPDTPRPDPG